MKGNGSASHNAMTKNAGERRRNVRSQHKTELNCLNDKISRAKPNNKAYTARNEELKWPKKEFKLQNSYLTEAFKNLDIRGIRHLCYIGSFLWIARLIIVHYSSNAPFNIPGFATMRIAFYGFHYWLIAHFIFLISALIVYIGFQIWVWTRTSLGEPVRRIFDGLCAGLMIAYMSSLIFAPWWWLLSASHLGVFTKEFVVGEQVRICMKIISFLSEKIGRTLEERNMEQKNKHAPCTQSSGGPLQFIFFLYAPTLIYRDEYPRNDKVRWTFVLEHVVELSLIVYMGFVIYEQEAQPAVASYLLEQRPRSYTLLILQNSLPFFALLVLGVIGLWHNMQNIFAELLRFGDRRFHFDWWNEGTPAGFHRSNNVVVQDWLFYYVYYPIRKRAGSRSAAQLAVLLLSGVVHDIMLAVALGFATPIILSHFILMAVTLQFSKNDKNRDAFSNFMYLVFFPSGASFIGCYLSVEYLARQHCPRLLESSWDFFYPRFIDCKLVN